MLLIMLSGLFYTHTSHAQGPPRTDQLKITRILPATGIKDQNLTSTCWCFSGISMLESELIRKGMGTYDLSEMYIVRHAYEAKAIKYVRMHGTVNFSPGGAFNDVTDMISAWGIVPDEVYDGLRIGHEKHIHSEMDAVLKGYVREVLRNRNGELTPVWFDGFSGILDAYLGKDPESFEYKGQTYTPKSFAASLGLNMDDYVLLSSFSHHPFYEPFIIEIPDNWSWNQVYNLPLDELIGTIDHSLESGYTVAWGADESEKYFSRITGMATVPAEGDEQEEITLDDEGNLHIARAIAEKKIDQEVRQQAFDNYRTTDDHGMHIIGKAKDNFGKEYYIVKNSWGTDSGPFGGYYYVSEAYVRYKTTDIMVHRDAIPSGLKQKLGL